MGPSILATSQSVQQQQDRIQQLREEQAALEQQVRLQEHAANYEVEIQFPAVVVNPDSGKAPRTDDELIQHRLLEAGLLFEVPCKVRDTVSTISRFVSDLERTGCYDSVRVELGSLENQDDNGDAPQQSLKVLLDEKKWYRLHMGAGLKQDTMWQQQSTNSFMPTAEFETSIGLRNLAGVLDRTDLQYTLDTRSIASWSVFHERPLYTALPSSIRDLVLSQDRGSQYSLLARAAVDTVDHELTRSYKEFQRVVSVRAASTHSVMGPAALAPDDVYYTFEWQTLFRDVVPRRHATLPYHFDASREVVSLSGPSVKHSFFLEARANVETDNPVLPTRGIQLHAKTELATPPGDVGFCKAEANAGIHVPLTERLSIHSLLSGGYLRSFEFSGLCQPAGLSDRFYVGGPMSLRGFIPEGIGPRAPAGPTLSGGDSLGGDFFYTATLMASMSAPTDILGDYGLRLFCFGTAGTCASIGSYTSLTPFDIIRSSRCSVGMGLTTAALGPRLELTYAWPLRYGPRDNRKQFQFGMGFTL